MGQYHRLRGVQGEIAGAVARQDPGRILRPPCPRQPEEEREPQDYDRAAAPKSRAPQPSAKDKGREDIGKQEQQPQREERTFQRAFVGGLLPLHRDAGGPVGGGEPGLGPGEIEYEAARIRGVKTGWRCGPGKASLSNNSTKRPESGREDHSALAVT